LLPAESDGGERDTGTSGLVAAMRKRVREQLARLTLIMLPSQTFVAVGIPHLVTTDTVPEVPGGEMAFVVTSVLESWVE
jgi:hypothetical protein